MTMREKIARALARAEQLDASFWRNYAEMADAVLEAMMEPDEEMLRAYTDAADTSDGPAAAYLQVEAFRAMLTAAKGADDRSTWEQAPPMGKEAW